MELEPSINPRLASDYIINTLRQEDPYFREQFSSLSDIYNKSPVNIVESTKPVISRWFEFVNEEGEWTQAGKDFIKQYNNWLKDKFLNPPSKVMKPSVVKKITPDDLINFFMTQHSTLKNRNTIPENYDPKKWTERLKKMEEEFVKRNLPIFDDKRLSPVAQTYLEHLGDLYNNHISNTYNSKNPQNFNVRAGVVKDTMKKLPDIDKVLKDVGQYEPVILNSTDRIPQPEIEEERRRKAPTKPATKTKTKTESTSKAKSKKSKAEVEPQPIETQPNNPVLNIEVPQQEPVVPIAELRALNREAEENANIPQEQLREKYDFPLQAPQTEVIQPQAQPFVEPLIDPNPQPRLRTYFTDIEKELEDIENQPQPVIVQQPAEPVVIQPQPQPNLFVNPQQRKEVEQRLRIEIEQVKLKTLQAVSEGIDNIFGKETGVYIKLLLSYLGILGVGGVITKKLMNRRFKIFDDDDDRRRRQRRSYYYY